MNSPLHRLKDNTQIRCRLGNILPLSLQAGHKTCICCLRITLSYCSKIRTSRAQSSTFFDTHQNLSVLPPTNPHEELTAMPRDKMAALASSMSSNLQITCVFSGSGQYPYLRPSSTRNSRHIAQSSKEATAVASSANIGVTASVTAQRNQYVNSKHAPSVATPHDKLTRNPYRAFLLR